MGTYLVSCTSSLSRQQLRAWNAGVCAKSGWGSRTCQIWLQPPDWRSGPRGI